MSQPVVRVVGLEKTFVQSGPWPWSASKLVHAVRGVDFEVAPGEVLALVGQSGSGKTTVSRMILGLERPTQGEVWIDAHRWDEMPERARRPHRVNYQYVPQDAMGALDPQQTALEHVIETLSVLGGHARPEAVDRARAMLDKLGLGAREDALPREMSGGEQRRVTLARVLALEPRLVVADEPTSGLDPDRRQQVLQDLVGNLPKTAACILVTHDMSEARQWSSRVLAMLAGRVIEEVDLDHTEPQHPYARILFDPWSGALPRGVLADSGCPYRHDCPLVDGEIGDQCTQQVPLLADLCNDEGGGSIPPHRVACHVLAPGEGDRES
jgi:ABC-type glutathione transport system ATPase component